MNWDDVSSSIKAFAQSVGESATLGLTRPVAAGVQYAARNVSGYPTTYQESYQDILDQEAQRQKESPIASLAGNVTGAVLPAIITGGGAPLVTGGGKILQGVSRASTALGGTTTRRIASNTAAGAVQGATTGANAKDIAKNAAVGGTIGALFGAGGEAVNRAAGIVLSSEGKSILKQRLGQVVRETPIEELTPLIDKALVTDKVLRGLASTRESTQRSAVRKQLEKQLEYITEVGEKDASGLVPFITKTPTDSDSVVRTILKGGAKGAAGGLATLGLQQYLDPNETILSPVTAAVGGAILGGKGAAADLGRRAVQNVALRSLAARSPGNFVIDEQGILRDLHGTGDVLLPRGVPVGMPLGPKYKPTPNPDVTSGTEILRPGFVQLTEWEKLNPNIFRGGVPVAPTATNVAVDVTGKSREQTPVPQNATGFAPTAPSPAPVVQTTQPTRRRPWDEPTMEATLEVATETTAPARRRPWDE